MSRTNRRRPNGFNPGERHHEDAKNGDYTWSARSFERSDIYHNRDWKPLSDVHDGCAKSPKGFCDRSTVAVGSVSRSKAKRHSAHVNRQRGKNAIRRDLSAD